MQNKNKSKSSFFHVFTANSNKKYLQKKDQQNETPSGYEDSLKQWVESYIIWQQSGENALQAYTRMMKKDSKENDMKLMHELTEKWSKTWSIDGKNNPYSWYWTSWKKIWEESSYVTTNAFNQYWQKMWQSDSDVFFKRSNEVLRENKKWMDL